MAKINVEMNVDFLWKLGSDQKTKNLFSIEDFTF